MSTTNNQSIQQINTAALRGTREAHQPDEIKLTTRRTEMTTLTREQACNVMVANYDTARVQLGATGLFGKTLDNKARKLALKLGGVTLPEGMTIAWATPDGWGKSPLGYRGQTADEIKSTGEQK